MSDHRRSGISLSSKIVLGCSLTLVAALGISFSIIAFRQERLIMGQLENEARVLFKQIVITREWIADHGGIFVEKLPWTKPSQFLTTPEITDLGGKRYVRETPAMVTKELSRYSKDRELYWFHITSLKLTNPENAPDEFEKKALARFEQTSIKELVSIETIDKLKYLRYISPLYVEKACLKCHAEQGYKIGDVRGAISITIPMEKTIAEIASNRQGMLIAGVLTIASLMLFLLLIIRKLVLSPMSALKNSINRFSEGEYSPESRIQTGDEFEDLGSAFSEMAGTLTEYHDSLNDKIQEATRFLQETNLKLQDANSQLNEANIRKSDFVARASHELRTPLTSIKGAMEYLSVKLSPENARNMDEGTIEDLSIFFEVIKKNAERLIRMVTNMLDLERLEIGVHEWQFTNSNLSYLIAETLTNLQVNADAKGIFFNADLPESLPVFVDEDRMKQVLTNLISNAVKFSPEGSEISISAFREGAYVVAEIYDRGPVIKPQEMKKIFEKFYKTGKKEGTGLGLAICKNIIENHNGILGVRPRGDTDGNCFYFRLTAPDHAAETPREPDNKQVTRQQKLLEIAKKMVNQ